MRRCPSWSLASPCGEYTEYENPSFTALKSNTNISVKVATLLETEICVWIGGISVDTDISARSAADVRKDVVQEARLLLAHLFLHDTKCVANREGYSEIPVKIRKHVAKRANRCKVEFELNGQKFERSFLDS